MPIYTCDNCKHTFKSKTDHARHIKKKKKCLDVKDKVVCVYCNSKFSTYSSLKRHIKTRCRAKKELDEKKEELLENLMKEHMSSVDIANKILNNNISGEEKNKTTEEINNSELLSYIIDKVKKLSSEKKNTKTSTTINNNNNTQINGNVIINNIKLLPFGQEDLSYITDEMYKKLLHKGLKSVPAFVETVHFNVNSPQNHNVFISNKRDNYVLIYDGKQWTMDNRNKVIDTMITDKTDTLTEMCERLLTLGSPAMKKFQRFLDKQDGDETINNLKEDIKLILYNKIKKTPEEIIAGPSKLLTLQGK